MRTYVYTRHDQVEQPYDHRDAFPLIMDDDALSIRDAFDPEQEVALYAEDGWVKMTVLR